MTVAQHGSKPLVHYADVAVEAAIIQDELLATSLRHLYLEPLAGERDGGESLRQTLRAYLAAGGSLSSAGTMLGVSRRTIGNRLRRYEELVGRPLHTATAEIDAALRVEAILSSRDKIPNR